MTGIRVGYSIEHGGEIGPELLPSGINMEFDDVELSNYKFH